MTHQVPPSQRARFFSIIHQREHNHPIRVGDLLLLQKNNPSAFVHHARKTPRHLKKKARQKIGNHFL